MKDDDHIDGEWHPEAFTAGMEARQRGYGQNDRGANPYVDYGDRHWMYRSFVAGWCDRDQSLLSESSGT